MNGNASTNRLPTAEILYELADAHCPDARSPTPCERAMTTITGIAVADHGERCVDCESPMPPRSPASPNERRCQDCWWADQTRRYVAGDAVHPLAVSVLRTRHGSSPAGE